MTGRIQTFAVVDYVVFSLTVLVSVCVGIYFAVIGRRHNTTTNFFLGDRKLKYGPVALSLVVTFQSSIMMLGFPTEVYLFGYMIFLFNFGQCAAIFLATRLIVPLLYPLKITSVYNYLNLRYKSNAPRILTVCIGIISQCIYMGIVLFGPSIALQSVTSFPAWASIVCIASASILYTSIGGILAVVWTDVLQFLIIMVGIIAILIKGTLDTGGVEKVWQTNLHSGRLDMFDFNPDPTVRHTFWTIVTGSFVGSFSMTLSQSTIQRFNSTPKIQDANKVLYIAGPTFIVLQTMSMSVGLVCFAYFYTRGCDPLMSGQIQNPNQIVPFMILDIFTMYPGLSGLFISALFSASLSTLSSLLSGLSAITVEDIIKPYFKLTDNVLTVFAKLAVVVYGALGVSVAFVISMIPGSLTQILFSIMGAATGPSVGIFFLAMFYSKSSSKGVVIGGIVGLIVSFWICIGSTISTSIPKAVPLPLPPTDQCPHLDPTLNPNLNLTMHMINRTTVLMTSAETTVTTLPLTSNMSTLASKTSPQMKSVEGIDKLYTLSYALLSTLGTLVTLIVGFIASLFTYNEKYDAADPKYVLSLSKQLCCCIPSNLLCRRFRRNDSKQAEYDSLDQKVEMNDAP